jgi:8-oxo-dGTP pyrophosphatase MutT (NUDIX family)
MILVKQFRPPIGKYTIENPAGLIDGDESAEHAAIRELKEETGYVAHKIVHVSQESFGDLGASNSCSKIVHVNVDGDDPLNQNPQKHNDEGEFTEVVLVPLNQLFESLVEFQKKGYGIAAVLHAFAYGLHFAQQWTTDYSIPIPKN